MMYLLKTITGLTIVGFSAIGLLTSNPEMLAKTFGFYMIAEFSFGFIEGLQNG